MISNEESKVLHESIIRLMVAHVPYSQAYKGACQILEKAIAYINEDSPSMLVDDYGDYLLMKEKNGVKETRDLMISLRKENVIDDDIRWYYNMGALRNWMYANISNVIVTVQLRTLQEEGMCPDDAAVKLRKTMPVYGEFKSIPKGFNYVDRNLPPPIQRRVNIYIALCIENQTVKFQEDVYRFSSCNAFIRNALKHKKLNNIKSYEEIDVQKEIDLFRKKIDIQKNQLFGIRLYWEAAKVSQYQGYIENVEGKAYKDITDRTSKAIDQSNKLLAQIEIYPEFAEYLCLFHFPPISGHQTLEEVTKRAEFIVYIYDKLFQNRPREKSLSKEESLLLLENAEREWTGL